MARIITRVDSELSHALDLLPLDDPHPCPYLPGRLARLQGFVWTPSDGSMPSGLYQRLMDQRFRRAGSFFYRPNCDGCAECVPIRIAVSGFTTNRWERRALRRNGDVRVDWKKPRLTPVKARLYSRYLESRHPEGLMTADTRSLRDFLYSSPLDTIEAEYSVGDRLIAAGICDLTPSSLSTVYFYFDPDESRRSLGVYSTLVEIEEARRRGLEYYYLGYRVKGCRKMEYKARLGPHELLLDGRWKSAD